MPLLLTSSSNITGCTKKPNIISAFYVNFHSFISFAVPSLLSHFITLFFISSLSLYRVTVYCLCRCVPQENWLLFSLKWQSSDEALKCVEACPSALGSDWTTAIVQVVFVFLNWIEPDQLNTQTAYYWVRCGGESNSLAFYFPYRENKVLFLIHRLMLPQIVTPQISIPGVLQLKLCCHRHKTALFMAKELVSANLLCGPVLWIGL